jgi:hypothetical protein
MNWIYNFVREYIASELGDEDGNKGEVNQVSTNMQLVTQDI